jgi:hypothetical protein
MNRARAPQARAVHNFTALRPFYNKTWIFEVIPQIGDDSTGMLVSENNCAACAVLYIFLKAQAVFSISAKDGLARFA